MKTKQYLLASIALTLLLFSASCSIKLNNNNLSKTSVQSRQFWFNQNMLYDFDRITAELMAEGKHCTIWAEAGRNFSAEKAKEIANSFDNIIYPRLINTYSPKDGITYEGQKFSNIMEFADRLGDGDGKLRILVFNRFEGVSYFLFSDLSKAGSDHPWSVYSNNSDMIYIAESYLSVDYISGLIAHETAHLINYVSGLAAGRQQPSQELWINEGLATAAEWLYHDGHPNYRWWIRYKISPMLGIGNLFFNLQSENPFAEWQDYLTGYLFFSWLRLQAGTQDIWYDIITSPYSDYRAVTIAANKYMPGQGYDDWGTLLRNWLAANYINAPNGPLGYMNDSELKNINARILPPEIPSLYLAPGEGVFSDVFEDFTMPANTGNIRYASLRENPPELSDTAIFPGGVLLTYNVCTDIAGNTESGIAAHSPAKNYTATKFEGDWIGRFPHSPLSNYNHINFTGNTFTFKTHEGGEVRVNRTGLFTFTNNEITFIPDSVGSWHGYTQPYSFSGNEITLEFEGKNFYGVLTRQ